MVIIVSAVSKETIILAQSRYFLINNALIKKAIPKVKIINYPINPLSKKSLAMELLCTCDLLNPRVAIPQTINSEINSQSIIISKVIKTINPEISTSIRPTFPMAIGFSSILDSILYFAQHSCAWLAAAGKN